MPKLPLIVGAFIMSTILSPVVAIDVNIPGADAKIPKDAYINYQATNQAIEQDVSHYTEMLKATDKDNGISKSAIEYAKATSIYRAEHYHNTVISVHDKYGQVRLSFPVGGIKSEYNIGRYQNPSRTIEDYRVITDNGSLNLEIDYADYKDQDWRNTKIAYEKLTDKDVRKFLQDKAKKRPEKHISDIKATVFSYPTITYGTWDSMKMPYLKNDQKTTMTVDTINFKHMMGFAIRYPLYHVGIAYFDNKPVLNKVPTDNLLANYVLPSVKNLNELNEYSRIENLNGIKYRVPKDALFEGESKEDYQDMRYYKKGSITFFVSTINLTNNPYTRNNIIDGHYNFSRNLHSFWDIYRYHPTPEYINYAVVWNNNIPGLSIHSYEPYRDIHILNFESYDGTYHFIYTIFYPNFLNAEEVQKLRNMIEFFDSTNNPEFKLQEHVVFPET
ncbi:hypothetical protein [Veillonella tobetsuensis]|uniref:DUF3857 domain-containing protein n=1 Tax=Veillonella tobetsuensis TaxID=1110546 RepID=A0A2S7ZQT8_9FIRM|nr:hypothetical protein [Veillonella tobetsuensis]PQL25497.1 hypothetical protein VTHSUH11_05305 [Veillonella tobetsuensis]